MGKTIKPNKIGNLFTTATLIAAAAAFALAEPTIYEAENEASVAASAIVEDAAFSGGKYVANEKQKFDFKVTVEETAVYDIVAAVHIHIYDWVTSKVLVNGVEAGSQLTTPRNCDSTYFVAVSGKLRAGENTISVGEGAVGVDYISVERHPDVQFKISATPVTPGATPEAQKLMTFLRDNFMKKTISGMMIGDNQFNYHYGAVNDDGSIVPEDNYVITKCTPADSCGLADERTTWKGQEDISLFKEKTGYYPALGGFDMLFAAGGHSNEGWFSGYTENNIRMAAELWELGGIPAFSWHWKVDTDTVFYSKSKGFNDPGCKEGVVASSADNTCFNYTKAFKGEKCAEVDASSKEYAQIMADVDKLSKWFLKLQDEGAAAIWRPLHEASGGWFWWGVAGPDCYKQLYKLVFDRMVNTNGVKNLLWTWNINTDPEIGYDVNALNAAWYPGDEYVDIVGVDIYNNSGDLKSNVAYFNKIVSDVGTNKVIALTENGPITDVDSIFEDKSVWSFWMPWYNTWSGNFLSQTPDDAWKKNLADERVIKLESMPGWDKVEADVSGEGAIVAPVTTRIANSHALITNKLSATVSKASLTLNIPKAGQGEIALYDIHGKLVARLSRGNFAAGSYAYNIATLPRGMYFLKARIGTASLVKAISVK